MNISFHMSPSRSFSTVLVLALSLLAVSLGTLHPAHAQDGELLPTLEFDARVMQSAQFLQTEYSNSNPASNNAEPGFHRVRANLEVTAQFHERISAFIDLGHEPNDFGTGGASFAPAVDYVALDLMLNDALTVRLGTPVTGLFNFRGYSDGAAVQGNPLIGNSPIDFITAETGIQLVGATNRAAFDLTVTTPDFFETFAPGTGFTLVAKGSVNATDNLAIGAGVAQGTNGGTLDRGNIDAINLITGDGENYNVAGRGQANRYTHASLLPGASPTLFQLDARGVGGPLTLDLWGGIGFEGDSFANALGNPTNARQQRDGFVDESSQMWWLGATATWDATDRVFLSARGSYAANSSDWASGLDETALYRIQAGFGFTFWDVGMMKFEVVTQEEGVNSPGQLGTSWYGALAELSVGL